MVNHKTENRLKNKNGSSNLEAIIAIVVAVVVGAALMSFGQNVKNVVNSGSEKVNEVGNNIKK